MKKKLLCPLLALLSCAASAQSARLPASLGYTRTTAYSNRFADAFSFSANGGALAGPKNFSAGVYSERRFLLKELSAYSAAVVIPTASGNFGLRADYSGDQAYHDSQIGLAYGRSLGSKVAAGVQFNYVGVKAAGYGNAATVNVDAGLLCRLTPQLSAGLQVYNPLGRGWGKDGLEKLPAIYSAGLGYDVSPQVYVGLEAEKVEDRPVGINAGLHYQVTDRVLARVGLQSAAPVYFLGLGVKLKAIRFDATASLHPFLGLTPGLQLLYQPQE